MLMTSAQYRESLREYKPRVFIDGRTVDVVADDPALLPGINAIGEIGRASCRERV